MIERIVYLTLLGMSLSLANQLEVPLVNTSLGIENWEQSSSISNLKIGGYSRGISIPYDWEILSIPDYSNLEVNDVSFSDAFLKINIDKTIQGSSQVIYLHEQTKDYNPNVLNYDSFCKSPIFPNNFVCDAWGPPIASVTVSHDFTGEVEFKSDKLTELLNQYAAGTKKNRGVVFTSSNSHFGYYFEISNVSLFVELNEVAEIGDTKIGEFSGNERELFVDEKSNYATLVVRDEFLKTDINVLSALGVDIISLKNVENDFKAYVVKYSGSFNGIRSLLKNEVGSKFYNLIPEFSKNQVILSPAPVLNSNNETTYTVVCYEQLNCRQNVEKHVDVRYANGHFIGVTVSPSELELLKNEPNIMYIEESTSQTLFVEWWQENSYTMKAENHHLHVFDYKMDDYTTKHDYVYNSFKDIDKYKHSTITESPFFGDNIMNDYGFSTGHVDVTVVDNGIDKSHWDFSYTTLDDLGNFQSKLRTFTDEKDWYDVQPWDSSRRKSHGTHVAGIIGGRGWKSDEFVNGSEAFQNLELVGVSPLVNFHSVDYEFPIISSDYKGHIINRSTGSERGAIEYRSEDYEEDYTMYYKQFLDDVPNKYLVVAAGNSGDCYNSFNDTYCGYYSLGNQNKNALIIGNAHFDDVNNKWARWGGSSMGPATNDRIKPDLMAPGTDVVSNYPIEPSYINSYGYSSKTGSSMAAPFVSGVIANMLGIHREINLECTGTNCTAWDDPNQQIMPLNSTIKGILINTAKDMDLSQAEAQAWSSLNSSNNYHNYDLDLFPQDPNTFYHKGPDFSTGFGMIEPDRAYRQIHARYWREEKLKEGENVEHRFSNYGKRFVEVTIAWDDPSIGQWSGGLLNDFDLHVVAPNGVVFYPWRLDNTIPSSGSVSRDPVSTSDIPFAINSCSVDFSMDCYDHVNNVEKVQIDLTNLSDAELESYKGEWVIHVQARKIDINSESIASPSVDASGIVSIVSDLTIKR